MDIDPVKLAARLLTKPHKDDITLRVTIPIYKAFQDACGRLGLKASHVIDEFMREFCEKHSQPTSPPAALSPAVQAIVADLSRLNEAQLKGLTGTVRRLLDQGKDANTKGRKVKQEPA